MVAEGQTRAHICLLGPGGMGKTSTALAVMAHFDIKQHFPERSQVWVPCVKATSVSLLLDTLYTSLGMSQHNGNALNDIVSELKSSEPLILLLDNFETPWNADGAQSEVERILRVIEQIPHITLFITMRSSSSPCNGISWHSVDLRAIDDDAAHLIYSTIYVESSNDDPKIPELLHLVGNIFLAIKLMATVGKLTGLGAQELIDEYRRTGTTMLGPGSDAEHNMDICISLSFDSPLLKKHSEAYELLAILAMLPVGTTHGALGQWWARNLTNLTSALRVLRETSLVERWQSSFFVLPVIRVYVLDPSRFSPRVRITMIELACLFLMKHKSSPGDASHKVDAAALAMEEGNLQTILLNATVPDATLIKALLVLASHQERTRPRVEVIEHALKLLHQMHAQMLLGDALYCHAKILCGLDKYKDSLTVFDLAREAFLEVRSRERAAQCLLDFVDVQTDDAYQCEESERDLLCLVEQAKAEFEELDDTGGILQVT
ncbi:hypothetical protein D9615_007538 [Tricholomella constricta]|uniref:ATPase AAA-type core domain-containing protein n=1 Tax=Tricholomella constricta TaxID=117010 RepID=A0A8H5H7R7_9AGAR|nr:hypothetical protein D9615_007538 [Tricholomella constricta]